MRRYARGLLLLAVAIVVPHSARNDETPRTSGDWTTQEWPMRGQNPNNLRMSRVEFENPGAPTCNCRIGSITLCNQLPVRFCLSFQQYSTCDAGASMAWDGAFGGPATEYVPQADMQNRGFGWMFSLQGTSADVWELATGRFAGSAQMPCAMGGTPSIFVDDDEAWLACASWGRCGRFYLINFELTPTRVVQVGNTTTITNPTAAFRQSLSMELANDRRIVTHPVCPGSGLLNWFLVDEERKDCTKCASNVYRIAFNFDNRVLQETWRVPLQIGSGLNKPLPKGQAPPPAQEVYFATTAPVVRGDDLLVVGGRRINDDNSLSNESALFAFDPRTGAQYWVYKMFGRIIEPDPVILDNDVIIFGTDRGRVTALQHVRTSSGAATVTDTAAPTSQEQPFGGTGTGSGFGYAVRWETSDNSRLRDHPLPFNTPEAVAEVALYGPAVDRARRYAYFGGSDGRVHRFQINDGAVYSSRKLLNYFVGRWTLQGNASFFTTNERDGNGEPVIRTCAINSAPAISQNDLLFVKVGSRNMDSNINSSFLMVLSAPDLTCNPNLSDNPSALQVVPGQAVFRGGSVASWATPGVTTPPGSNVTVIENCRDNFLVPKVNGGFTAQLGTYTWDTSNDSCRIVNPEFGGVALGGWYVYQWIEAYQTHAIIMIDFLDNFGRQQLPGYFLKRNPSGDEQLFNLHVNEDIGGVGIAEGFVMATDRSGAVVAIPSNRRPSGGGGFGSSSGPPGYLYVTPYVSSSPTYSNPAPPDGGPALVYPNPFDPDKAVDGVLKILNLPAGAQVEIATLANERVLVLTAGAEYRVLWDGRNGAGQPVAAGPYYYTVTYPEPGRPPQTGRFLLIRR